MATQQTAAQLRHDDGRYGDGRSGGGHVTFGRVLRSEIIKFRSLLSTLVLVLATVAVLVGFGALGAWGVGSALEATGPEAFMAEGGPDRIANTLAGSGVTFAQLIIGSLAVLVISSEFATGSARSTFAAVPKRYPVFLAKVLLVAVVSFVVSAGSMLLTAMVINPIVEHYGLEQDTGSGDFQRMLWIGSLYVTAVALSGFALGALLRNSAGAIVSLAGLFFVLPVACQLIPGEFVADLRRFLPSEAASQLITGSTGPETLELWQSWVVLGAWVVVPLALAGTVLQRRDV
ncbi:ABC transporter permease [Zafaria cholistanensis]|nr:ABC transporter permease [Zafaria cholistanensis]